MWRCKARWCDWRNRSSQTFTSLQSFLIRSKKEVHARLFLELESKPQGTRCTAGAPLRQRSPFVLSMKWMAQVSKVDIQLKNRLHVTVLVAGSVWNWMYFVQLASGSGAIFILLYIAEPTTSRRFYLNPFHVISSTSSLRNPLLSLILDFFVFSAMPEVYFRKWSQTGLWFCSPAFSDQ